MNEIELKPCPHCGAPAKRIQSFLDNEYYVRCSRVTDALSTVPMDCPSTHTGSYSVSVWNRRDPEKAQLATIAAQAAEITRLRDALEEIRKPATIIGFGKKATGKMRAQQLEEDHVRVRTIAANALKPQESDQ